MIRHATYLARRGEHVTRKSVVFDVEEILTECEQYEPDMSHANPCQGLRLAAFGWLCGELTRHVVEEECISDIVFCYDAVDAIRCDGMAFLSFSVSLPEHGEYRFYAVIPDPSVFKDDWTLATDCRPDDWQLETMLEIDASRPG